MIDKKLYRKFAKELSPFKMGLFEHNKADKKFNIKCHLGCGDYWSYDVDENYFHKIGVDNAQFLALRYFLSRKLGQHLG